MEGLNFSAADGNILRGFNPEADFVATNFDDSDGDVFANENLFVTLAAENKHGSILAVVNKTVPVLREQA
jgi:hypothetical protein